MAVIGIVTGQFDILHPGYISFFQFAKTHCNKLHVFLNVQPENKEPPIFSVSERVQALMSLKYIDEITPYDSEASLYQFLENYNFNYTRRFLGEEYRGKTFTGKDLKIPVIYHPNNGQWHYTQVLEKAHEKFLRIKEKDTK